MRKSLFALLLVLLLGLGSAALADTPYYSLSPAPVEIALSSNRYNTVLTAANADQNLKLLGEIGFSKNDLIADFDARGVVLQAWRDAGKQKPCCLEITVVRNDLSALYPNMLNLRSDRSSWKAFEAAVKAEDWEALGYKNVKSIGQKPAESNYFLKLTYDSGSKDHGILAITSYQGYLITLNYKVYNHTPKSQYDTDLWNAVKTIRETVTAPQQVIPAGAGENTSGTGEADPVATTAPAAVSAVPLTITVGPPKETNTNTFTIEGTTQPGAHLIGVLQPITLSHVVRFETDADKKGNFKMKVTLPENEETTWLMTLNVFVEDKLSAEWIFDTTLYKKTLIPVTFDQEVPEKYAANELVVSGVTLGITEVQCLVTSSNDTWEKKIRTNHSGIFNFKIPLKTEGEYSVALVFTKKGSDIRREKFTVSRYLTDEARNAQIRKDAKREGYNAVAKRIDQYVGQILTFRGWITEIEQVGEEWRITVAGTKTGDHYSQYMVFMTEQEPAFAVEEVHYFYGRCIGPYQIQSEEGTDSIPSFDLLVWD